MKEKLLFEIIVTNQCNKRCPYCKLDFKDSYISNEIIEEFCGLILNNTRTFDTLIINFFGGEPLLKFEVIRDIVTRLKGIDNIRFSVGTNGLLLTKEHLDFFQKYNFEIYLSLDTETGRLILNKDIYNGYTSLFLVNLIIDPNRFDESYDLLAHMTKIKFGVVNVMPVFSTMSWSGEQLEKLDKFVETCRKIKGETIYNYYSYFNDVGSEKQFILETNGNIYQDLDSLLWIQKQYKRVGETLGVFIDKHTYIGNISSIESLDCLLQKYSISKIVKIVKSIPVFQGYIDQYSKIDSIMKKTLK